MARTFGGPGSGDGINVGTAVNLRITGNMSFSCWLKTTATTPEIIFVSYTNATFVGWAVGMSNTSANGKVNYWSSGIGSWAEPTSTHNSGAWVHFGLTINGTGAGAGTFYKNGASDGTWSHTAPGSGTGNKYVGLNADGTSDSFTGDLAEMAIWNTNLSANEMAGLGRGVLPFHVRPGSLQFYMPIYGTHTTEPDFSTNKYNGTLVTTPDASNHAPVTSSLSMFQQWNGEAVQGTLPNAVWLWVA